MRKSRKTGQRILSTALALMLMVSAIPTALAANEVFSVEGMNSQQTITGNTAVKTDGSHWTWGVHGKITTPVRSSISNLLLEGSEYRLLQNGELWQHSTFGITTGDYTEISPVKVMDGIVEFAGEMYTKETDGYYLALKSDDTLLGWGDTQNLTGVFGDYIQRENATVLLTDVTHVEQSNCGWMALKNDGTLWSAGLDYHDTLNPGAGADWADKPLGKIMDNVAAFSVNSRNALVIKTDGSLWSWGDNQNGQVGNGGKNDVDSTYNPRQSVPVKILDDVIYAKAGWTPFAITSDGTLYGWGINNYQQLGFAGGNFSVNGEVCAQSTPKKLADNVAMATEGPAYFSVIVKRDGTLWTAGENSFGQTGHPQSKYPEIVPTFTKLMDGIAFPEGMVSSGTVTPTPEPVPVASEAVAHSVRPVILFTDEQGRINRFHVDGARIPHYENGEVIDVYDDRVITVTTFSENYKPVATYTLPLELTYIGGLFVGENYNFMVYYDYNLEEKSNVEVLRVVKYSKDWARLGQASITGGEIRSYGMAYGGNFSFAEYNGMLYIHTAQSMLKSSDGQNHQANLTVSIQISDMTMTDSSHVVANNSTGYVSHSKAQDIMVDSQGNIITLDNGDSYPNGAFLFRYGKKAGAEKYSGSGEGAIIKPWTATDWYTGSDTQALVETSIGYLAAYIDSGMGSSFDWQKHPINAYITFTPRDNFSAAATKTCSVTTFTTSTNESVYSIQLVPVNMESGYVIVTTYDRSIINSIDRGYRMYWAKYSADGSVTALTKFDTNKAADGNVIYTNNQLVWLEYTGATRQNLYIPEPLVSNFYTFDGTTLTYHADSSASTDFSDVPSTHWSYEYVKKAVSYNLVQGVGDGKYEPERNVSNAEWATMAVNLFYKNDTGQSGDYWWSANMDIAGAKRNILAGTTVAANGTSHWDPSKVQNGINRYDMAQVIYNIAKEQGWTIPDTSITSSKIADWSSIPSNYSEAVAYCFSAGFVTGVDNNGTFNGASTMTRAQAATVLCRLLDAKNTHN